MSTKAHKQLQFGVLPCRVAGNGRVQVMLLTSRETGRWVIPKGWPMKAIVQDRSFLCEVKVYLFWVEQQLTDWPEKDQRQTQWFDLQEADNLVREGSLAEIMRRMTPEI
jgi:hypothetical protein